MSFSLVVVISPCPVVAVVVNRKAMLGLIDENKALDIQERYYSVLRQTGYMKHNMVLRYLAYIFLLDFIDYAHGFFTEGDYNMISKALSVLFTNGGCLMPYPVFCANRAVLGRNEYMGTLKNRITEDLPGNDDRFTEDDYMRTV